MPIFRIGAELHYYAHVPKCAGSAIEDYLIRRFGPLAFANTKFTAVEETQRWTKSSPQHAAMADVNALIPESWIASSFAVVRHPVKRLVSSFQFQIDVEKTVPEGVGIDEWFDDWLATSAADPFRFDNHLRPQSALIPAAAKIFRMEEGLGGVVAYLDSIAGNSFGAREIAHVNVARSKSDGAARSAVPSAATMKKIAAYYAADFRRFGYDLDTKSLPKRMPPPDKGLLGRITTRLTRRG
jgi:hypothetical protein